MSECAPFYRKYIQAVVSQANLQKTALNRNFVYGQLTKWLREQNIRLEKEMFRAVLSACNQLADDYLTSGSEDIKAVSEKSRYFHTFTGLDGLHTDTKQVKKYITDFWPVLKECLDTDKVLGDASLRSRRVDVVCVGRLFDSILEYVADDKKEQVVTLMDEFMRCDLES